MTGIMEARERKILAAIENGLVTSTQIGPAIGEAPNSTSAYLNMMATRKLVERGPRASIAYGGACIQWRVRRAAQ